MALVALGVMLALVGEGQRPLVVMCPGAGEAAAVALVARTPEGELSAREAGATALLGELLTLRMSRALAGEAALLARALPAQRGIEVGFEPDYLAVTVAVVRKALPEAVDFLRRWAVETPLDAADFDEARERVLKRRDTWAAGVVEHTAELMVQVLSGGRYGWPLYGTPESLRALGVERIAELWRKMLAAGNVCVSLEGAGETPDERLTEAMAALTGALPQGEQAEASPQLSRRPRGGAKVEDNPNVGRASLVVGFAVEPYGQRGYWAARVLREMLAGPSGALMRDRPLAAKLGLILPDRPTWQDWPLQVLGIEVSGHPYLAIHAVTDPAAVHVAAEGIVGHVRAVAEGKITGAELDRARRRAVNQWARETARVTDRAVLRGVAALLGEELPDPKQVATLLASLRKSELQAAAQDMLKAVAMGVQMPRD